MDKVIQASEANRQFSRILREVREGDTYTITAHGRPVARIVPAETDKREAACKRLLERLQKQPALRLARWTREDLYD
jgi:prevent-host-death family protein